MREAISTGLCDLVGVGSLLCCEANVVSRLLRSSGSAVRKPDTFCLKRRALSYDRICFICVALVQWLYTDPTMKLLWNAMQIQRLTCVGNTHLLTTARPPKLHNFLWCAVMYFRCLYFDPSRHSRAQLVLFFGFLGISIIFLRSVFFEFEYDVEKKPRTTIL
jgi:hypothetical protein